MGDESDKRDETPCSIYDWPLATAGNFMGYLEVLRVSNTSLRCFTKIETLEPQVRKA